MAWWRVGNQTNWYQMTRTLVVKTVDSARFGCALGQLVCATQLLPSCNKTMPNQWSTFRTEGVGGKPVVGAMFCRGVLLSVPSESSAP